MLEVPELLGPGTLLPWDVHCAQRALISWFARRCSSGSSAGACGTSPGLLLWDGRQNSSC